LRWNPRESTVCVASRAIWA